MTTTNPRHWLTLLCALLLAGAVFHMVGTSAYGRAQSQTCLATQFGHVGDTYSGDYFRCYYNGERWSVRKGVGFRRVPMSDRVWGIAHRTLPCGQLVKVTSLRTNKSVLVPVVDRGPYWAVPISCGRSFKTGRWTKAKQKCWQRGRPVVRATLPYSTGLMFANCGDLTPLPARAVGLGGRSPVTITPYHGRVLRIIERGPL